jgi:hypothetical protein
MARVHDFQRYSQKENVATNNTLLLLSRLYQYRPSLLEKVLNTLVAPDDEENRLRIGVAMEQQKRKGGESVPDGFIEQQGFRLIVETKRGKDFTPTQITGHAAHFEKARHKVLLLLGSEELIAKDLKALTKAVHQKDKSVQVVNTTFNAIVAAVRAEIADWQEDLRVMIEDYAEFCTASGLLSESWYWMRMVLSGKTFDHKVYYDIASHGYSAHDYIGLYTGKSVRAVGRITNIITADIVGGKAKVISKDLGGKSPTADELRRIEQVTLLAQSGPGYDIRKGHRFFLVEEFEATDFKKITPNAPMGKRFFDLREFGVPVKENTELPIKVIADRLRQVNWK